ncbi:MAG: DUF11 domain-containing protein [Chloroflexi bacterium]|nr:DUF11 domain-containing protein [Chloroflexota bacterium]
MKNWKSLSRLILLFAMLTVLLAGVSAPVNAAPKSAISSLDVVISEVAWSGTKSNASDEWLELYNTTNARIDLSNWKILVADGNPGTITIPSGKFIPANGYFLLERSESAIKDITADYVYGGSNFSNTSEVLSLADSTNFIIDTANAGCSSCWYQGSESPDYYSMERVMPAIFADGTSTAWKSNDGVIRNGLDASNNPINGTPHNSQIDLSLSMVVNNSAPTVGSTIEFTVTVTNHGNYDATHVSVIDVVPTTGLTSPAYLPSSGTTYDPGSGVWNIGTLASTASATFKFSAQITAAGVKTNRAEIWTVDQFDPNSTPDNGITTEDDFALVKATTPDATALNISNSVNNSNPAVGTNVIFTIVVENPASSLSNATNVSVDAKLPTGLNYISYSSTTGTTYNGSSGIWSIGNLNKNTSVTINITAKVITSTPPPYSATVTSDEFLSSVATVSINDPLSGEADLSLTQSAYAPSTTAGNAILTITVTNNGPDNATGVDVKDLLPSGLSYVSVSAPSGTSYSNITGIWTVGNLANAGASKTLKITVKASASGTSTNNFAEVWNSDQYDPDSTPANGARGEDDEDSEDVLVSDLSLTESVDLSATTAIFTIRVSNSGPDNATGINVKTSLPALTSAYTFSSYGSTQGTYDQNSGIWNVGSLADGANASLTITTNIVGTLSVNWVEISKSDQVDPDSVPDNNSRTEDDDASAPAADLSLSQSVNNPNPDIGDSVIFSITVTNAGAGGTTNVQVKDVLPSGLTYVSNDRTTAYTSNTGIWVVGALDGSGPGRSKTLNITAKVAANGIKTNWAEVWKSDSTDPDSRPGNGSTTEDDDASASITSYRSIVINEIAWAGTAASHDDQWIELYNPSTASIDISGWTLRSASNSINITLAGVIKPKEYFLLERDDNDTVKDITADQIYTGALSSGGEFLTLRDNSSNFIDTANKEGSTNATNPWPKGVFSSTRGSMERQGVTAETDRTWATNIGNPKNGLDAKGGFIYGTPRRLNSVGDGSASFGTPIPFQTPTPSYRLTGRPIINEFLSRPGFDWNQDGRVDVFDEFIEIKNIGLVDININGWILDDEANLGSDPYRIPSMTLKPGERKVFYGLTTNILLGDGGDTVRLINSSGLVMDSYTYTIVKVEDQSTCRLPDEGGFVFGEWLTDCVPTPNLPNTREGTAPSMPGGGALGPATCDLPDTLPIDFLFAECRGYGVNIWSAFYWDHLGWLGEMLIPQNVSKWDTFVK